MYPTGYGIPSHCHSDDPRLLTNHSAGPAAAVCTRALTLYSAGFRHDFACPTAITGVHLACAKPHRRTIGRPNFRHKQYHRTGENNIVAVLHEIAIHTSYEWVTIACTSFSYPLRPRHCPAGVFHARIADCQKTTQRYVRGGHLRTGLLGKNWRLISLRARDLLRCLLLQMDT
jgi:hypothetical protein